MGTFIASYIGLTPDNPTLLSEANQLFRHGRFQVGPAYLFIELTIAELSPPELRLQKISESKQTAILWIAFQSSCEAFQYLHWHHGRLVRALEYGLKEEGTWERVEGVVEPWEGAAMFSENALNHVLEFAETDSEKRELRDLWAAGSPKVNKFNPHIDARETARAIAEHYRLPGWT